MVDYVGRPTLAVVQPPNDQRGVNELMTRRPARRNPRAFLEEECVREALRREVMSVDERRITYRLHQTRSYNLTDPEEPVRAYSIAWLVVERDYPPNRIRTEVSVPRRQPTDYADVVVYQDDACAEPYLVVEDKAPGRTDRQRARGIEQGFGNANSLRAPFMLYDEGTTALLFDVGNHPPMERERNRLGPRDAVPSMYGAARQFVYIAGEEGDIEALDTARLEAAVRRVHGIIWSGGRRDPLTAFDEWSKLLFAKVADERTTPNGAPRRFQVGTNETDTAVANRVRILFTEACREDPTIFPAESRIDLSDSKIAQCVTALQAMSLTRTDVDSVGAAFEQFFGRVFRGDLGQYFTRRELARFTVAVLRPTHDDFVIDPTAGSGGFLLESLLQVWHQIDRDFGGQGQRARLKIDFALQRVFGIEIHDTLARICKINLLLHHDGHTNIEGSRSCLDSTFSLPRLNPIAERFSLVVGNPPFGDEVKEGDEDKLGENHLASFEVAAGPAGPGGPRWPTEQSGRAVELSPGPFIPSDPWPDTGRRFPPGLCVQKVRRAEQDFDPLLPEVLAQRRAAVLQARGSGGSGGPQAGGGDRRRL